MKFENGAPIVRHCLICAFVMGSLSIAVTGCKSNAPEKSRVKAGIPAKHSSPETSNVEVTNKAADICAQQSKNPDFWMRKSLMLIMSPSFMKLQLPREYELIERSRFLNKTITAANILIWRTYLAKQVKADAGERPMIPFAALVPYGSHNVGEVLDKMYEALEQANAAAAAARTANSFSKVLVDSVNKVGAPQSLLSLMKADQAVLGLILTNYYIYKDTLWQQIVLAECGISSLIAMLDEIAAGKVRPPSVVRGDPPEVERQRAEGYAAAWKDFAAGENEAYAKKIIRIEQVQFVQRFLFLGGSEEGKTIGMQAGQNVNLPGINDANFRRNPTFKPFAESKGFVPDYSNLELRYSWLTSTTSAMLKVFATSFATLEQDHIKILGITNSMLAEYAYPISYPTQGFELMELDFLRKQDIAFNPDGTKLDQLGLTGAFYEMDADLRSSLMP
jgi:hypothetical protein